MSVMNGNVPTCPECKHSADDHNHLGCVADGVDNGYGVCACMARDTDLYAAAGYEEGLKDGKEKMRAEIANMRQEGEHHD